jgi:hypothetical protein
MARLVNAGIGKGQRWPQKSHFFQCDVLQRLCGRHIQALLHLLVFWSHRTPHLTAPQVPGAAQALQNVLEWCGVVPDEGPAVGGPCGPYVQSERLDLYREHADTLLESGAAYRCFCSEVSVAYDCSSIGPNPDLGPSSALCCCFLLTQFTPDSVALSPSRQMACSNAPMRAHAHLLNASPTRQQTLPSPRTPHQQTLPSPRTPHQQTLPSPRTLTQIVRAGSTRDAAAAGAPHAQAHSVRRRVSKPFARRGGTTSRVGCTAHGSFARAKQ